MLTGPAFLRVVCEREYQPLQQESGMPKKAYSPENMIGKLRQIELLIDQGKPVAGACREAGNSEQSDYR